MGISLCFGPSKVRSSSSSSSLELIVVASYGPAACTLLSVTREARSSSGFLSATASQKPIEGFTVSMLPSLLLTLLPPAYSISHAARALMSS